MLFFVYVSSFFPESSAKELEGLANVSIVDKSLNVAIVESDADLCSIVRKKKPVFIYGVFPLRTKGRISKGDYLGSIYRQMLKAMRAGKVGRDETVFLECYDINNRTRYSAKDIEVSLGQRLNSDGYKADIIDPTAFVYAVLLNGVCYAGTSEFDYEWQRRLNPLRRYMGTRKVSRAEFKIREAFEEFGISGNGIAIDLGAAPGGWSLFLHKRGYKVIAVDPAKLDYAAMKSAGARVITLPPGGDVAKSIKRCDVLHIKAGFDDALRMIPKTCATLIADDMNLGPLASAAAVLEFVPTLTPHASLVLTVKCMSRNAPKFMREAKHALSGSFEVKSIKALPSNRQEVTLFASRSGSVKASKTAHDWKKCGVP